MSRIAIQEYYGKIDKYKRYSGTTKESSIRRAFANLLEEYCMPKNLILVDEVNLKGSSKRPDGTVKDALQLDWGFWESKDSHDVLDVEIEKKLALGYPNFNILFENSVDIVLIQEGNEVLRGKMSDESLLDKILNAFVNYERPEIKEFHRAIEKFREDIPVIVEALRAMIEKQSSSNKKFIDAFEKFKTLCQESINPDISVFDINEMLIQHILTAEIFEVVFNDSRFHRENNIARELEHVVDTFFTGKLRKDTLRGIESYYLVIKKEAGQIDNHHEKQNFLKVIYENFYKAYNPKGADRLGVVYTPNEIVKFMIESTDYLLDKHFGKSLKDKNVEILDPATGTGTFITDIIEHIPPQYLAYKYKNEIHANELAILPYYIANLNIEFTYHQKMNDYQPFENIVFVDTLDNLGFNFLNKQEELFGFTSENLERIKRQNEKKISVIIGNPPYNANQMNENDENKNRDYFKDKIRKIGGIDGRIRETFIKESSARKTKLYDPYARFYRWAMDRIENNGIIAFITNNSFIHKKTFDGFRKTIFNEFDYGYIIDLGGDIRDLSGRDGIYLNEKHTIFGKAAMVGIAIAFFIKLKKDKANGCSLEYIHPCDIRATRNEKIEFLKDRQFKDIQFEKISNSIDNNWIHEERNEFAEFITIANNNTKLAKKEEQYNAIFKLFTNGIVTNRDEWVYDYDQINLKGKIKFFINEYNSSIGKVGYYPNIIKWSRDLKNEKKRNKNVNYNDLNITQSYTRPFVKKYHYCENILNDMLTSNHFSMFGDKLDKNNLVISLTELYSKDSIQLLAVNKINNKNLIYPVTTTSLSLPLYRYKGENRIDNITDWGLEQFVKHYKTKITKEDIFHYVYGVLHNPAYRKKYEINLKREFPRIPFYKDFKKWAKWGKTLMDLHINYETVEPCKLKIKEEKERLPNPKAKLKADTENGIIILDENTCLTGIPAIAWSYKLGNRSALHWILDQYKEKKPSDPTIAEKFNTYKFADYKDQVIDLLKRVTTVSVKTMEIVNQMPQEENHTD